MENASKALIIAGAILISILLITVGITVMNAAGGATDQVEGTSDTMARQTFNAQFSAYEGSGKSAGDVKALIALIKSNNGAIKQADKALTEAGTKDKYVYLETTHPTNGKTCITSTTSLSASKAYKIEIIKYSKNGFVQSIAIY